MTYKEVIDYLYNSTPVFEHVGASAYKEGLENTIALDEYFGHPHRHFKTIHVAGTNGKGSCSHTIASVLQEAGYKVGLYTSPHLVDFRERIRVNGLCISEAYVVRFVSDFIQWNENTPSQAAPKRLNGQSPKRLNNQSPKRLNNQSPKRLHPSFFELTTALAFKYFAEQKVDIAVIEVGLGGRLDCTNIITPILSVITNISFDHTGFLGATLAKIAAEKAGIIKPGVPVVIGEYTDETRPVFQAKAQEMHAPIYFAQDEEELGTDIEYELKGDYQKKNKQTIMVALERLASTLGASNFEPHIIERGFAKVVENTGLMGRWQTLRKEPLVICDTGHNLGGWQYLHKQIKAQPCKQLRIVFGMVDDKDIDSVMSLLPKNAVYYWTQADNHRAIPTDTVAQKGRYHNLNGTAYATVADAYTAAIRDASPSDFIFIGGSSYIVADLLFKCF